MKSPARSIKDKKKPSGIFMPHRKNRLVVLPPSKEVALQADGAPLYKETKMSAKICKLSDCNEKHYGKGLCRKHYDKQRCQRPEVKAKQREYKKEYRQRPEVKARAGKDRTGYYKEYGQRTEVKKKRNERLKIKYSSDATYNLIRRLTSRFRKAFILYSKIGKIMPSKKYGIDWEAIIEHLKPFPQPRENYHIDHIIPLCSFDFNNPEEIKKAFAPENHQWLTAHENISKGRGTLF